MAGQYRTKVAKVLRQVGLGCILLGGMASAAWAEAPLGDFLCVGHNAGDSRQYKGYVSVIPSGDTYTVMWRFGQNTYIGTGLDLDKSFAVTFMQPNSQSVGLLLLKKTPQGWLGKWTTMGGKAAGAEAWRSIGGDAKKP